jgi:DNA topoisomerase-1
MKTLLIVESPAKSKTIEKLLGPDYVVLASFGHIRNLDKKNLGIEVDNDFRPIYKILCDKKKQIKAIEDKIKTVDRVLLASDEDREGEAIAWHCAIVFKLSTNEKNRICFHEITKSALEHAVNNPREIDMSMVYSQQARRILDRLVGFKLSPLLWKHIAPKLSAGRVQSAALKIIVIQENEIKKFSEKKYYKTIGTFDKKISGVLNIQFDNKCSVEQFLESCKSSIFTIKSITKTNIEKRPAPPYTTSSIQQDIGMRFGLGSKKIMSVLQHLYEQGHITYHRTDSTNLSKSIQNEIKEYIINKIDKKYVHLRSYISKIKCAQEAHEAIRPTHIDVEVLDNKFDEIDKKIYNIIWKRTVSSQMSASKSEVYNIIISISNRTEYFTSKAEKIVFDGYKKIYEDIVKKEDSADLDDTEDNLPSDFLIDNIEENEKINYIKIVCNEKYHNPPFRYSEATLIKKMEKNGIGRPSTYSSIIETLMERKYIEKKDVKGNKIETINHILEKNSIKEKKEHIILGSEKKKLIPSELGIQTTNFLEMNFNKLLDIDFTALLEEKLDNIANNKDMWNKVVSDFYYDFLPQIIQLNDSDKKRFLGNDEYGKPVYAYVAKFGPVFQIDNGKNAKYIKLNSNMCVDSVTLEDLKKIDNIPKVLGMYEDKEIILKNGVYGYYLSYNNKNYKILENYDKNLSLEEALECLKENNEKKIGDYIIKTGKYGPYILFNKKFYNIPQKYNIENITKDQCYEIIQLSKKN